ncbi:MAG: hypothetical protein WC340_17925 [Kiritimatiellia bacterium]
MAGELGIKWKNEDAPAYKINADNLHQIHPDINTLYTKFLLTGSTSRKHLQVQPNTAVKIINGSTHKVFQTESDAVELSAEANLDTGTALAPGKDYYVYVCDEADGTASVVVSLNSTYPNGYSEDSSRKIGGFHTLCADVGTISGHDLSGYVAGDILPASVWCLTHRPECEPEGMVWSEKAKIWVDIYMQSGVGENTASAYGATMTDSRTWLDFVDDLAAVGKTLLHDPEFQVIAAGSNEETNIVGSSDPGTTGGHTDTAGRRMISDIGCEDCCGVMYQWLVDQSYRGDGTWSYGWTDLPGDKGSLNSQGAYGDAKLLAGGDWLSATRCGSRCRFANSSRWFTYTSLGGRGRARSQGAR